MTARIKQLLADRHRGFHTSVGKLETLSPLRVLSRGYSLTRKEGHVVSDAANVKAGDRVEVKLSRGELDCIVESVKPENDDD